MGEDVLAGRHAEQREPAGRIAHARDGLEADVVRSADQTGGDDVGHRGADQPDGGRRRNRSVRRHEAAGHAYCRHRPHRDRDVRSLLAGCDRNLRRRPSRRRGGKVRRRIHRPCGPSATAAEESARDSTSAARSRRPAACEAARAAAFRRRRRKRGRSAARGPAPPGTRPAPWSALEGTSTTYVPGINCESRNMPRSSVVAVGTSSECHLHVAVPRASGEDVLDERPHRDADDRFAGFVHDRAGDDAVLPHLERDVGEPPALGERQELALTPGTALAVRPRRIAFLRGVAGSTRPGGRSVKKKRPSPSAITRLLRRVRVLEILRHPQPDDGLAYGRAGGRVNDLADDHSRALAGRTGIGGDGLCGRLTRQDEHDEERHVRTCSSEPGGMSTPGHDGIRILLIRAGALKGWASGESDANIAE